MPSHELLCGGFPCQAYSRLGAQRGLEADPLFWEARTENDPGHESMGHESMGMRAWG